MAKKKKTQLKPVQRGFAITSTPKKVVQLEESSLDLDGAPPRQPVEERTDKKDGHSTSATFQGVRNTPSEEEVLLQGFVDRLQDKTEREILRTIKAIEVDRRFSQTLLRLEIDPILRQRILDLAVRDIDTKFEGNKLDEDPEEKLIARLGINYGVLRKLGFDEDRVKLCFRSISGIDLDDAIDWLYLHCPEEEITLGKKDPVIEAKEVKLAAGVTLRKNFTPPSTPASQSSSLPRWKLDGLKTNSPVAAAISIPADSQLVGPASHVPTHVTLDITARNHAESEEDTDEDELTTVYVRLKLKIDDLLSKPRSQSTSEQLHLFRKRLDEVTSDYLFDEKEALSKYQLERKKLDKLILQERLLASKSEPSHNIRPPKTTKVLPSVTTTPSKHADLFDDDSDDSSEGVLGILDDPDSNEITVKGVTYNLRNMTLPKNWSGLMPKTMLRDFIMKLDKYATISYSQISTHSRARRASVTISWQSKLRDEWIMEDVACTEDSQAEQYVAIIALHSLMFPVTDGFVSSAPISTGGSSSFRLLPAIYRELWDELESYRKSRDDAINRAMWGKVKALIDDKIKNNIKISGKQVKSTLERPNTGVPRPASEKHNIDAIADSFRIRQASSVYQEILTRRNELPIANYRHRIIELLDRSQVLVLSGETGCGKSTQVPAFILEDHLLKGNHCKILCTEPRRISAISLAQRVAYELCDPSNVGSNNSLVGYSIRLESNISRNTRLAFVTNGIALRMLEGGTGPSGSVKAFDEITHLIIDEVHERTIESDFLLIVLKTLLLERPDLKVVLMSATLDAEKISSYFGNCDILQVPGRTFPVQVKYLEDAIEYTKWMVSDASPYARRNNDKFYKSKVKVEWSEDLPVLGDDDDGEFGDDKIVSKLEKRYSPETAATLNTIDERLIPYELIIRLLEKLCHEDPDYQSFSRAILIFMPGLGEIRKLNDMLVEHSAFGSDGYRIYPLHSTISSESQGAAFEIPPLGIRKIVIATNIAETGITIPDITCVIDTGKHREMRFDEKRQLSRLVETFIAKSNAAQRRGRAGRVQHGLCFHLFTKIRHDIQMVDSPLPEMLRLSLADLALRIKIMKVKLGTSIEDVLSRALDPPISINVQRAVSMLIEVRALTPSEEITPMGRLLSKLPTDVHLGKFLLVATIFRCLDPALTIAAALNSKSPFVSPFGLEQEADRAKNSFRIENSDFLTIHNAFSSWRTAHSNTSTSRDFCRKNFLSYQNLQQIEDLRQQFLGYLIDSSFIQADESIVRELSRARYMRNKTRFVNVPPDLNLNSAKPALVHAALAAGLYPKILSIDPKTGQMRTITNNQQAFIHPSSVNFLRNPFEIGTNHLAYFTLMQSKKLYAWETAPIDDLSILLLCGESDSKIIANTISVDRKIRLLTSPKTNISLKILRERISSIIAQQYQDKAISDVQAEWMELALIALNRTKLTFEKDDLQISIR